MAAARTVLVVRPREQARRWVEALRSLGVEAVALPLIEIAPAPDARSVGAAFDEMREACEAAGSSASGSTPTPVVVFVSPNAVGGFFDAIRAAMSDATVGEEGRIAWPAGVRACAAGPGTAAALAEAGVPPDLVTSPRDDAAQVDSEALWQEIGEWDWIQRRVWIVRGNGGREWLAERLRAAGARVETLQAYARSRPTLDAAGQGVLAAAVAHPTQWAWMFSSSEAIANLRALAPVATWAGALALASHPRIAESARAAGFGEVDLVEPTVESVASAVRALQR